MQPLQLIAACLLGLIAPAVCWADGGVVRAIERSGPFQISAFTSPNPLLAGTVDISLLVQDAKTLAHVPRADVTLTITPRGRPAAAITRSATAAAATNKLLRACLVDLAPGWYDVDVACEADGARGTVRFPLEVGAAAGELAILWPWFAWPAVPVVLFGMHRYAVRKKAARRGT